MELQLDQRVQLAVGMLCVLASSVERFQHPIDSRRRGLCSLYGSCATSTSTTRLRYWGALTTYSVLLLGGYLIVALDPTVVPQMLRLAGLDLAPESEAAWRSSSSLGAALFLTVLLPMTPLLKRVELSLRSLCQRLASIPAQVLRLRAQLRDVPFTPPPSTRPTGMAWRRVLGEREAVLLERAWSLLEGTASWEANGTGGYVLAAADVRALLLKRRNELVDLLDKVSTEDLARGTRLGSAVVAQIRSAIVELYEDVLEYVVRGLLKTCITSSQQRTELKRLGFEQAVRFDFAQPLSLFVVSVWALVLGAFLLIGSLAEGLRGSQSFIKSGQIATYVCLSVFAALRLSPRAPVLYGSFFERPFLRYLAAGGLAALGCLAASFLFKLLRHESYALALQDMRFRWPWQIVAFTLAAGTCAALDIDTWAEKRRSIAMLLKRAWPALALAVAGGLAGFLAGLLMRRMEEEGLPDFVPSIPDPPEIAWLCSAIGLVTGFFLPAFAVRGRERDLRSVAEVVQRSGYLSPVLADPQRRTFEAGLKELASENIRVVTISPRSAGIGKSLRELDVRNRTKATVVAIDRPGADSRIPSPDEKLSSGDRLAVVGDVTAVAALEALLA